MTTSSSGAAPDSLRQHPLLGTDNAALALAVVLMLLQLRGGTVGELAALVAVPLLALMTFLADRRYIPAILVLCIPTVGILTQPTLGAFDFPETVSRVVLAGVEVHGPLVVITSAFGRVCVELLRGGRAIPGVLPRWLILGFLVALMPTILGGLLGQSAGLNQWSIGVRAMLAIGGLFWGVLVAHRARGNPRRLVRQLCTVVTVGAALVLVRFVSDMYVFLLMGMSGGLLPYFVARRRLLEAGILLGAALVGALAISLTTAAEVVVALGCVMLATVRTPGLGKWLLRSAVAAGLATSVMLIWVVRQLQGRMLVEFATRADGVVAFGTMKLLGDRGPLWLAAMQQIVSGPYLIVPAGRSLRPDNFNYGYIVYLWDYGAHNTFLELLRHVGLIAGAMGIAMMLYALVRVVQVLSDTRVGALRGLAAGVVGVAVPGMTTGNFPIYDVGFFLWAMAGMVITTHLAFRAADSPDELADDSGSDGTTLAPAPVLAGHA